MFSTAGGVPKGKNTQHVLTGQRHNDVYTQGEMGAGGRRRETERERDLNLGF